MMTTPGRCAAVLLRAPRRRRQPAARVGNETLRVRGGRRRGRDDLPEWPHRVTPHVLRHFCASQLYLGGMDLVAIQQVLGHAWIATTMNYVHVHASHIEDAWITGQQRAAGRLTGLGGGGGGAPGSGGALRRA